MKKLLLEEALFEDEVTDDTSMEEPTEEEVAESEEELETVEEPEEYSPDEEEEPEAPDETYPEDESGEESIEEIEEPATITYKVSFNLGTHDNWSRVDASSEEEAEQLVTDYITNKWPDRKFEVINVEEFEEVTESLNESLNENAPGEGKYSDKFYEYLIYLIDESKVDAFPYLIDQLIRYCKEEDLKDLWFERMEKVAHSEGFRSADEIIEEALGGGQPIKNGASIGMASLISDLIKDEYEAIDGYNSAMATAAAEGYEDMIAVLSEIQSEENVHIGQLQTLMTMVDPNAHMVEDGRQEGEEQLLNDTSNMSEDWHDMNDREYARVQEITNKFHRMSARQFYDLYMSGTIKPTLVQCGDEIPGYKWAIDIDSIDLSQGTGNVVAYVRLSPVDGNLYCYVSC